MEALAERLISRLGLERSAQDEPTSARNPLRNAFFS